jgi:hypothetical protein
MLPPDGLAAVEIIEALTPPAADGFCPDDAVNGGHSDAQLPVHTTFPPFSGVNTYNVRPCPLTSTVPRLPTLRVESEVVVLDELELPADAEFELELLLLPQAIANMASGATSKAGDLTRASLDRHRFRSNETTPASVSRAL